MEPIKRFDIVDGPNAKTLFDKCKEEGYNSDSESGSDVYFEIKFPDGSCGFVQNFYIDKIELTPGGRHSISGGTLPARGLVRGVANEELLQWKRFSAIYDHETRKGLIEFESELD